MTYPDDAAGLYRWILLFLVVYLILAYLIRDARGGRYLESGHEFMLTQLFNSVTFAGSLAVIWAVVDPKIMKAIGDTTMFLLLAGLAGVLYSLRQLLSGGERRR